MKYLHNYFQTCHADEAIVTNILKGGLAGMLLGFILALLSASWVWIEMRINVGLMIPSMTLVCMAVAAWRGSIFDMGTFLIFQLILLITFLSLYGFDYVALRVVPASLFREGFRAADMSLYVANIILVAILGSGNIIMFGRASIRRYMAS